MFFVVYLCMNGVLHLAMIRDMGKLHIYRVSWSPLKNSHLLHRDENFYLSKNIEVRHLIFCQDYAILLVFGSLFHCHF